MNEKSKKTNGDKGPAHSKLPINFWRTSHGRRICALAFILTGFAFFLIGIFLDRTIDAHFAGKAIAFLGFVVVALGFGGLVEG